MTDIQRPAEDMPILLGAYPQLFVADLDRSCAFYETMLGFRVAYRYGTPPFYALIQRGGAGLNLRHLDRHPIDPALRVRETLLSANVPVHGVVALYREFRERGADLAQALRRQPWGTEDFIVRDPDGHLICFASASGAA